MVGSVTFISCLEEGRSLDPAVVVAGEERVVVVCRAGEEGDNAPSTLNLTLYRVAEVGGREMLELAFSRSNSFKPNSIYSMTSLTTRSGTLKKWMRK